MYILCQCKQFLYNKVTLHKQFQVLMDDFKSLCLESGQIIPGEAFNIVLILLDLLKLTHASSQVK